MASAICLPKKSGAQLGDDSVRVEERYCQEGLDELRTVANRAISQLLRIAIFSSRPERNALLEQRVASTKTVQIVFSQPILPSSPVIRHLREQGTQIVLVDLPQSLEESVTLLKATRGGFGPTTILAIGQRSDEQFHRAVLEAGVDRYFGNDDASELSEALDIYHRMWEARTQWVNRSSRGGGRYFPSGGSPPPGGSTPPTSAVWALLRVGPRAPRPRKAMAVAV